MGQSEINELKREILAELRTTIDTSEDADKCKDIERKFAEHKEATAILIENLNQKIDDQFKALTGYNYANQVELQNVDQRQGAKGNY